MVWLPLLDAFRTFYWSGIIEELQNTCKLKELINLPVIVLNNMQVKYKPLLINKLYPYSYFNYIYCDKFIIAYIKFYHKTLRLCPPGNDCWRESGPNQP